LRVGVLPQGVAALYRAQQTALQTSASRTFCPRAEQRAVRTQRLTRSVKYPPLACSARKPLFDAVSETIVISAKILPLVN
jgi:hypothetical protein